MKIFDKLKSYFGLHSRQQYKNAPYNQLDTENCIFCSEKSKHGFGWGPSLLKGAESGL